VTEPEPPPDDPDPQLASELTPRDEPFLLRILRSTIAPPVLGDGGHDAPMTQRGKYLFYGAVGVLVMAIAVLFVLTLAK
jgi:hypothetical protein